MYFLASKMSKGGKVAAKSKDKEALSRQNAFLSAVQDHKDASVQRFDAGGQVAPNGGGTTVGNNMGQNINGAFNPTGGYNPLGKLYGSVGTPVQNFVGGIGGAVQGFAQDFTPQNTFQASTAPTQQTDFSQGINAAGSQALSGYGNSQNLQGQQQQLAQLLAAESQGQGPNPAQAQLAQNTGQNVANQGALMASQRGAGANPALIARQAAQQGAATQQGAIGQAATLQAQQNLAEQQALQQQQANMVQGNLAEQGVNAGLFGTSAQAQNAQNSNEISNFNNAQTINSATAQNNTNAVGSTMSGITGGLSALTSLLAGGGSVSKNTPSTGRNVTVDPGGGTFTQALGNLGGSSGPQSNSGQYLSSSGNGSGTSGLGIGSLASLAFAAKGGKANSKVPALVSPGERYLPPKEVKDVAEGKKPPMKAGHKIPGKPKVPGAKDSYANDTVPATLDEGGIVLPRSVTQAKNPAKAAHAFVSAILKKKAMGGRC